MDLSLLVNILTAVTLVTGFLFAAYEWRGARRDRQREAQILLLRSFDTPEFTRSMRMVMDLPDGLSKSQLEARLGNDGIDLLWYWLGVLESVGLLAFNREIDIRMLDQTYGGPVMISWRKLRGYVAEVRDAVKRDSMHEWYQWLAEHLETLERTEGRSAAYLRERDWRP